MIRTVPTGDLGLDVLLGGGWRLVRRLGDAWSATVVVRGGSGAGKTLVGIQVALELARALGGDVAVGCVEILPTEYIAQLQSARPSLPAERVAMLPACATSPDGPRVYVGLMLDLDPDQPDLVASLESLQGAVAAAGGKPVVFLVDSLIEGYGIGSSSDRLHVDAAMKFAAKHGIGLVFCEEISSDAPSPWVFAADTVLQVGVESRERGRWIEVKKHRFGPSATGRHELDLVGVLGPKAFPLGGSWLATHVREVLRQHGWVFGASPAMPIVDWLDVDPGSEARSPIAAAFVFITGYRSDTVRASAIDLGPIGKDTREWLVQLDPIGQPTGGWSNAADGVAYLPTEPGASRGLRTLVERFAKVVAAPGAPPLGRVVIGDLGVVLSGPDSFKWVEALRAFIGLVVASGWAVPVIAYDGQDIAAAEPRSILASYADFRLEVSESGGRVSATADIRWPRPPRPTQPPE
ncbi:MAG: hypothetical protein IPL61_22540 [Myxococcales bacterium]|nr:hypothetical protein [Myxococcales bacterium]